MTDGKANAFLNKYNFGAGHLKQLRKTSGLIRKLVLYCKGILYSFYWILIPTIGIIGLIQYTMNDGENGIISGGIIGGCIGFVYFIQKQKLEEAAFFRSLFSEFNTRYDVLNDNLSLVLETKSVGDNRHHLIDYFNLCAEEYLLYKKGYIPLEVWESWVAGMEQYWSIAEVRQLWRNELKTGSYYSFDPSELFSDSNKIIKLEVSGPIVANCNSERKHEVSR